MSNNIEFINTDISGTLNGFFKEKKYQSIINQIDNEIDNTQDPSGLFIDMNNFNSYLQNKVSVLLNNNNTNNINSNISKNNDERKSDDYKDNYEKQYLFLLLIIFLYLLVAVFVYYYFLKNDFSKLLNYNKNNK